VRRKVQLFTTCLGESFQPQVLKQMVRILERLGIGVEFPEGQTCCGQPFYNSGFQQEARRVNRSGQQGLDTLGRHLPRPERL
jgi:L-lactate dehydrogenase complex protein LldE